MKTANYKWWSLTLPKAGNHAAENEDAVYPEKGKGEGLISPDLPLEFVISDGATQTSFSNQWAEYLVKNCSKSSISGQNFMKAISDAQIEWSGYINSIEIPWHAVEKVKLGAYATIVWLELIFEPLLNGGSFSWKALSVGDSCLFLVRNKKMFLSFPVQHLDEFTNSPTLVPSRKERIQSIYGDLKESFGTLRKNDQLILVSDALAAWFLKQNSTTPNEVANILETIKSPHCESQFSSKISELRKLGKIRNDDTSIILVEIEG